MDGSPSSGAIEGRQAYTEAIRALLCGLPDQGVRDLWLVGGDFEAWPLDEPPVLEALSRWARPVGRMLHIVGGDFVAVQRRFPRFSAWRNDRSHAFEAWRPAPDERAVMGSWLQAGAQGVELLDVAHWRARRVTNPAALRSLAERAAALLHRCESAWPITTLGL
jgi:hypothetical protein